MLWRCEKKEKPATQKSLGFSVEIYLVKDTWRSPWEERDINPLQRHSAPLIRREKYTKKKRLLKFAQELQKAFKLKSKGRAMCRDYGVP